MSKEKVLISVRGGCIENIISTKENIEFVIIDHDNFENDLKQAIEEIGNLYSPDVIMSNKELDEHIQTIKQQYEKSVVNDGELLIPVEETPKQVEEEKPDVYIKDEGELAGIICNTPKAKKTAIGTGFGNDYSFMPNDHYRFDIFEEQVPVIIDWCEKQNLTYEEC